MSVITDEQENVTDDRGSSSSLDRLRVENEALRSARDFCLQESERANYEARTMRFLLAAAIQQAGGYLLIPAVALAAIDQDTIITSGEDCLTGGMWFRITIAKELR